MDHDKTSSEIAALPILLLVLAALCAGAAVWCLFFDAARVFAGAIMLAVSIALFALALHFLFQHTRRSGKEELHGN